MPDASVIIVTRNRKLTAQRAVASAVEQVGDVEVVVFDDASTDGTADYITRCFPQVRTHRGERHAGLIVQRNRAAELAGGRVLVSIDDDAVFTEPTIVRDTLRLFDDPRVGAVAIPFVNHHNGVDAAILPDPPDRERLWVRDTFVGTAYAVRRDVFLHLGGFEERLYHWGEEVEYCQRLLAAGYVTAAGASGRIRHFPAGVGKYSRKVNRYVYRNRLLIPAFNAPAAHALRMIVARTAQSFVDVVRKPRELPATLEGLAMGYGAMPSAWLSRRPVPRDAYRLWTDLWRAKLTPFDDITARLPPMALESDKAREPASSAGLSR